jgi:hypothetical protein
VQDDFFSALFTGQEDNLQDAIKPSISGYVPISGDQDFTLATTPSTAHDIDMPLTRENSPVPKKEPRSVDRSSPSINVSIFNTRVVGHLLTTLPRIYRVLSKLQH